MKKYEITIYVNRADGTQTYGVMANSKKEALEKCFQTGELVREEIEMYWDNAYGDEPNPDVCEVEEFDYDYNIELEKKNKIREELFEKILREHVVLSELRNIYRNTWKCIKKGE